MRRWLGIVFVCAVLAGCGGQRVDTAAREETSGGGYDSAPGPVAPAPVTEVAVQTEQIEDDPKDDVKREADDLLMRDDGRPSWWFGGAAVDSGRTRVCAEALGVDMLGAKRAAVAVARVRIRRELGIGPATRLADELIERTWVWPLAHSETPGARYAGYVLVSVSVSVSGE